jgi:hypothetical protein
MQTEFDKYFDRQPELFFFVMRFRHWVTEKKGRAASCANEFLGGGEKWPKVAILGGKAIEIPNFNTGSSISPK